MTYEIGQKILVEARIRNPEIDGDGDIQIHFGEAHTDWVYVSAAKTREIPVEPTPIAFGDVRVGDVVRVTTKCDDGTVSASTGTVTNVPSQNMFHIGNGRTQWIDMLDDDAIELIYRPEPEPEPIKVGDVVTIEQVRTLPVGSVVDCGAPRTVSLNGLFNAKGDTTYGWHNYGGLLRDFTVKYIAGAS